MLRTPPLPATHAWVGYGWQNNRLYHFFRYNSYTSSLVSHNARVMQLITRFYFLSLPNSSAPLHSYSELRRGSVSLWL